MKFLFKEKRIGSAQDKRRYDLPLNKDEGSGALTVLLTLMTFMAAMTLAGSFAVGSMANRWSSGLENKITIEIPAENEDGKLRGTTEMTRLQEKIKETLESEKGISKIEVLEKTEVQSLIEPWLGKNIALDDVPLPGLISLETENSTPEFVSALRKKLSTISKNIELDTHENWLGDLLRLTNSLRFASLVIAIIIGAATASAIASAIKSRIAVYRSDVELLHFMGASDHYIMRQFQRHAIILAFQGSTIGVALSLIALAVISLISGDLSDSILPALQLNLLNIGFIIALPLVGCAIRGITARFTVMRVLARMP